MAVTANVKSVGLKIVSNYGEQNGKAIIIFRINKKTAIFSRFGR